VFRNRSLQVGVAAAFLCALAAFACDGAAARARQAAAPATAVHTKTGIDVLEEQNFAPLRGKRIGLITNQTGVDSKGRRTIDVLAHADGVKLVALFSPEHGIAGKLDQEHVDNSKDAATGVPIFSLYGASRKPSDEDLKGLDALVFDIQDAGVRFYTYTATMGLAMEAAAKNHIAFYVLDRPNPLGGARIEGPMLDADKTAFVAYFPTPIIYGMTLGELAQLYNAEKKIGVDLHVVKLENWKRSETFAETGLTWIPPSPNLRTVAETLPYPGIEILQAGGVSVGRGTATPFEVFGAPWIKGEDLAADLTRRKIPGVTYRATTFIPASDLHKGVECGGVALTVADAAVFQSLRNGLEIAEALEKLYPGKLDIAKMITLVGNADTITALRKGESVDSIIASWKPALDSFRETRAKYLIYE
jgi:uncharacterized protein YbbC (DUF1343 family)